MTTDSTTPSKADIMSRSRAVVKPGLYMILPQENRVNNVLPNFEKTMVHVLASPETGAKFVEHELMVEPGGGSVQPIDDGYEHFLYVVEGGFHVDIAGTGKYDLTPGGFAYLPVKTPFGLKNIDAGKSRILWIKRRYKPLDSVKPDLIVGNEKDLPPEKGQYLTPSNKNVAYDMGMLIVNVEPGMGLSQVEIHIMEHGLYMLQGQGIYWLGRDYYEVQSNDFIYMAPYCPQYFTVTGPSKGRYLLYKNVNRDYDEGL